jgi:hypothetical protein
MYPIQTGNPFMVQQSVTGTGVFDGTEYGRMKGQVPNGNPNAVVRLSARLYGQAANAYTIRFMDMGAGVLVPATTVSQSGPAITVTLRRDPVGGILATANEVADAINRAPTGLAAIGGGTGNGVVSAYPTTLVNNVAVGVDPALRGPNANQYLWYLPVNDKGGYFYFEQQEALTVRQFQGTFTVPGGTQTVTVWRVNLNSALEPVTSEAIPVFVWDQLTSARPDISVSDVGILLLPQQALYVTTSGGGLPGVVRFDVRKDASYPYAR